MQTYVLRTGSRVCMGGWKVLKHNPTAKIVSVVSSPERQVPLRTMQLPVKTSDDLAILCMLVSTRGDKNRKFWACNFKTGQYCAAHRISPLL